jgi:hypothetical protein
LAAAGRGFLKEKAMKIKLSKPQRSAVECSDLESHGALRAAARLLHTGYLMVPEEPLHRAALVADLVEAANSEDACWQALGGRGAIGACKALTNLARRVREATGRQDEPVAHPVESSGSALRDLRGEP